MANRKVSLARALVNATTKVQDPLQDFTELKQLVSGDSLFYFASYRAREAPQEVLNWCFDLCRENMKPMYEQVWGWSDAKKRKQLLAASSRFLIAYQLGDSKTPVGYVNYRFELDDGHPVLYLYEVQIAPLAQMKGLGSRFMILLERFAKQHSMAKVMLTVFKDNAAALALYKKLGYQIDETSPDYGASGDSAAAAVGYSIMSKRTSAVVAAS